MLSSSERGFPPPSDRVWSSLHCCRCTEHDLREHTLLCHPDNTLAVLLCDACHKSIQSVVISCDEDGKNDACSFCFDGSDELLLCDDCGRGFCSDCIEANFDTETLVSIRSRKIWHCFSCAPEQLGSFLKSTQMYLDAQSNGTVPELAIALNKSIQKATRSVQSAEGRPSKRLRLANPPTEPVASAPDPVSDFIDIGSSSDSARDVKPEKKRRVRTLRSQQKEKSKSSSSSSSSSSATEDPLEESASDSDVIVERVSTSRKKLRRIIDDDELNDETIAANEREGQRLQREAERRARAEAAGGALDAARSATSSNQIQINLGADVNEEPVYVAPEVAPLLKPHQIDGKVFLLSLQSSHHLTRNPILLGEHRREYRAMPPDCAVECRFDGLHSCASHGTR